jgi:hypothetical protein
MSEQKKCIKVDLGGRNESPDNDYWIVVDFDPSCNPDILHDLTVVPWPIEDNYADSIYSSHVVEHLPELGPFLDEVVRIAIDGADFELIFPHYSRSWFSNQHKRAYGIHILQGFPQFEVYDIKLKYTWWGWKHWYKFPAYITLATIEFFANLSPKFWERVWCYWFGGFDNVIIKAKINKDKPRRGEFKKLYDTYEYEEANIQN